jgi:hypothetical protein
MSARFTSGAIRRPRKPAWAWVDAQARCKYNRGMQGGAPTRKDSAMLPAGRRFWPRLLLSNLLLAVGGMLLLGAAFLVVSTQLNTWLLGQDRYLVAGEDNALPLPTGWGITSPTPVRAAQTGAPIAVQAEPALTSTPTPAGTVQPTPTSKPDPTPTATVQPTATPLPASPVRIRIPAIAVDRSVVELPLTYDERTRTWTRDIQKLLRSRGKDLVGHWGGSAYPGQEGNTILVGHNYGYGYNAVFVNLGRLKPGHEVRVVDSAGQTHLYRVKTVARVPWRRKDSAELAQHQVYLATGGPERLTLASCGGAVWAPFPVRIYVVADPVR